jgi:hypothetical protein
VDERVEIFTVQFEGGLTLQMTAAGCGWGITDKVLGMIGRLDGHIRLKIFRAKTNGGFTFLTFIARHDSSRFEMAFNMTREFSLEIRREILTEQNVDGWNLPMVVVAGALGKNLLRLFTDAAQKLGPNVTEVVFSAEGRLGWSLPMFVAEYAPDEIEYVLDVMGRFRPHVRERIFTAKGESDLNPTFPILVVKHAPGMLRRLLDMVDGLSPHAKVKVLTASIHQHRINANFLAGQTSDMA